MTLSTFLSFRSASVLRRLSALLVAAASAGMFFQTPPLNAQIIISEEQEDPVVIDGDHNPGDAVHGEENVDSITVEVTPDGAIDVTDEPAILGRGAGWIVDNEGSLHHSAQDSDYLRDGAATVRLMDGSFGNREDGNISAETGGAVFLDEHSEEYSLSGLFIDAITANSRNEGDIAVTGIHELNINANDTTFDVTGIRIGARPETGEDPPAEPLANLGNEGRISAEWSGALDVDGTGNRLRVTGVHFDDLEELDNFGTIEAVFSGQTQELGAGNALDVAGVRSDGDSDVFNFADGEVLVLVDSGEFGDGNELTAAGLMSEGDLVSQNDGLIEVVIDEDVAANTGAAVSAAGIKTRQTATVHNRLDGEIVVRNHAGGAAGATTRAAGIQADGELSGITNEGLIEVGGTSGEVVGILFSDGGFVHNSADGIIRVSSDDPDADLVGIRIQREDAPTAPEEPGDPPSEPEPPEAQGENGENDNGTEEPDEPEWAAELLNEGAIEAPGGTAVELPDGGLFSNTGTVDGNVLIAGVEGFLGNAGSIDGDVSLTSDEGTLSLNPGYEFTGDVELGEGDYVLELSEAREVDEETVSRQLDLFQVRHTRTEIYDGEFAEFTELHVNAPDVVLDDFGFQNLATLWRLTGTQEYEDGTSVLAGSVEVEDTLVSDVEVHRDSTLAGLQPVSDTDQMHTVIGDIDTSGILAAGTLDEHGTPTELEEGTGVFSVDGNVTFDPGSEYMAIPGRTHLEATGTVEIIQPEEETTNGDNVENGENEGNEESAEAPLPPPAMLLNNSFVRENEEYLILHAEEGLIGEFTEVVRFGDRPFILLELDQDDDHSITGTGTRHTEAIRTAGETRNQRAVARVLADLDPAPDSALEEDFARFLLETTDMTFGKVADRLSGETIASGAMAGTFIGASFRQSLLNTIQPGPGRETAPRRGGGWAAHAGTQFAGTMDGNLPSPADEARRHAFWVRGFAGSGDLDSDHTDGDLDYGVHGITVGVDTLVMEDTRAGAAFGYGRGKVDRSRERIDSDVFQLALYGNTRVAEVAVNGNIGYGYHDLDSRRTTPNGRARGSYDAHELFASVQAGTARDLDDIMVMPAIGLDYSHYRQGSFRESGSWALDVDSVSINSLKAFVGLRMALEIRRWFESTIVPELRFGYSHELLDKEASMSARFRGDPDSRFTTRSASMQRGQFNVGTGVMIQPARWENVSTFIDYDGNLSRTNTEHLFSAGVRIPF